MKWADAFTSVAFEAIQRFFQKDFVCSFDDLRSFDDG